MKRSHALILALSVAVAAAAGTYAAVRTTHLGLASTQTPRIATTAVARQNRALDRVEASLRKQLRTRLPALPALPKTSASAGTGASTPVSAHPSVIYVRPKPIVHVIHRHGGEHETERGGEGAGLDD